jgi:ligand-binding sensor protein
MSITRNSARCDFCGKEIESTFRHDFNVHYCEKNKRPDGEWNFAVDGGKAYIRRCGSGFTDTSTFSD